MSITWSDASSEVLQIADKLIHAHHAHLEDANIGFLFREGAKPGKDGRRVLGKASRVPARLKPYLEFDFIIWLDAEIYEEMNHDQRTALIDHELTHCVGEYGDWKLRKHDVEEFTTIIERYGLWLGDLLRTSEAIDRYKQRSLLESAGKVESALQKLVELDAQKPTEEDAKEPEVKPKSREEQIDDLINDLDLPDL